MLITLIVSSHLERSGRKEKKSDAAIRVKEQMNDERKTKGNGYAGKLSEAEERDTRRRRLPNGWMKGKSK